MLQKKLDLHSWIFLLHLFDEVVNVFCCWSFVDGVDLFCTIGVVCCVTLPLCQMCRLCLFYVTKNIFIIKHLYFIFITQLFHWVVSVVCCLNKVLKNSILLYSPRIYCRSSQNLHICFEICWLHPHPPSYYPSHFVEFQTYKEGFVFLVVKTLKDITNHYIKLAKVFPQ